MTTDERARFGPLLRHLRETVSARIGRADLPAMQVTAAALLACVAKRSGVTISQASYSDIENGVNLPRDPEQFLLAVCPCLAIAEGSAEWWALSRAYSYDLIAQKLGRATAERVIRQESSHASQ